MERHADGTGRSYRTHSEVPGRPLSAVQLSPDEKLDAVGAEHGCDDNLPFEGSATGRPAQATRSGGDRQLLYADNVEQELLQSYKNDNTCDRDINPRVMETPEPMVVEEERAIDESSSDRASTNFNGSSTQSSCTLPVSSRRDAESEVSISYKNPGLSVVHAILRDKKWHAGMPCYRERQARAKSDRNPLRRSSSYDSIHRKKTCSRNSRSATVPCPDVRESAGKITLVVEGKNITADRIALAVISKFFKALFSHQFLDSNTAVLTLDDSGEMGLTEEAVEVLIEFAQTRRLDIGCDNAIQLFIAADALDVELVRQESESYLGSCLLNKNNFTLFWRMSKLFHMKILESFMDILVLENFGWFSNWAHLFQYMGHWELEKLSTALLQQRFKRCSEEQIFQAVIDYCRWRGREPNSYEVLIPGLYKSCNSYVRYLQSVPRTLKFKY